MTTVRFAEENNTNMEFVSRKNKSIAYDDTITHDLSSKEKEMLWWMPLTPTASDSNKRKLDAILDVQEQFITKIPCSEGFVQTPIGDETKGDLPSIDGYDSDDEFPSLIYGKNYTSSPVTGKGVEDPRDIPIEWVNNFQDSSPEMEDNFETVVKEFESYVDSGY